MYRTTLTICIALTFWNSAFAEQPPAKSSDAPPSFKSSLPPSQPVSGSIPSVLKRGQAKTLGVVSDDSRLAPAVHVHSTGIDTLYSTPGSTNGTVDRLRSARNSLLLPPAKVQSAAKPTQRTLEEPSKDSANRSSRRRIFDSGQPLPAPRVVPNKPSLEPMTKAHGAENAATKSLSSVVKRRGQSPSLTDQAQTPTLAQDPIPSGEDASATAPTKPAAADEPTPRVASRQPTKARLMGKLGNQSEPSTLSKGESSKFVPSNGRTENQISESSSVGVQSVGETDKPNPQLLNNDVPFTEINIDSTLQQSGTDRHAERDPRFSVPVQPSTAASAPRVDQRQAKSSQLTRSPNKADTAATVRPEHEGAVLLSNRSPVLIVKTHGQPTIRVGRAATYYITATNAGDLDADDVVVSVEIPNWAEITRNQASAGNVRIEPSTSGDNIMKWSIRDLKQQSQQRLRIDLIPRKSRPIELGVTWNFKSVSALAQIEVQEAKLQVGVTGPADLRYGETKRYTITVSNPGTGEAENVVLTLLPINDGSGTAGVKELGTLAAGARRTIEVELTARQAGELAVRATASADGGLKANAKQDVRVRRANLVVQTVGPAKKVAGAAARYAVKVTNTGDATAEKVIAIAALPVAAAYVKSSNSGTHDEQRGRVRWEIGSLRPGAYQVVEVTVVLKSAGSNRFDVRTAGADRLVAAGSVETFVETLPDLKMSVDDPAGVVAIGEDVSYEVRVVNRGTAAANNVNIVGYFSEGIEPVGVRGWKANVEVGQVILDTIPHITPGQEVLVTIVARASRPGDHVFRAELHAKDPQTKLAQEEWTVFHEEESQPNLIDPGVQQANRGASPGEGDVVR